MNGDIPVVPFPVQPAFLLSAIAARWQLHLAGGADVHPVVSSILVPASSRSS